MKRTTLLFALLAASCGVTEWDPKGGGDRAVKTLRGGWFNVDSASNTGCFLGFPCGDTPADYQFEYDQTMLACDPPSLRPGGREHESVLFQTCRALVAGETTIGIVAAGQNFFVSVTILDPVPLECTGFWCTLSDGSTVTEKDQATLPATANCHIQTANSGELARVRTPVCHVASEAFSVDADDPNQCTLDLTTPASGSGTVSFSLPATGEALGTCSFDIGPIGELTALACDEARCVRGGTLTRGEWCHISASKAAGQAGFPLPKEIDVTIAPAGPELQLERVSGADRLSVGVELPADAPNEVTFTFTHAGKALATCVYPVQN